jgi:flagellar hook-length control protein FliK
MTLSIPPIAISQTSALGLPTGPAAPSSDSNFSDELGRAQSRQGDSNSSADQSQKSGKSRAASAKSRDLHRQGKSAATAKSAASGASATNSEDPEAANAADAQGAANPAGAAIPGADGSAATDTPPGENFDHIISNQTANAPADASATDGAAGADAAARDANAGATKPGTLLPALRDGSGTAPGDANPTTPDAGHAKSARAKAAIAPQAQQLNLQQLAAGQAPVNPLNPNAPVLPTDAESSLDGNVDGAAGNDSGIAGKLHVSPFDNPNAIALPTDSNGSADQSTGDEFAANLEDAIAGSTTAAGAVGHHAADKALAGVESQLLSPNPTPNVATSSPVFNAANPAQTPTPPSPDAAFAAANHPSIVSGIHGQLLPGGGTMQIRLDPPEMGAVQITVKMQGGALSASFQTSNDEATRMLSHSLGKLKESLESQGVSVTQLHVQRAPASDSSSGSSEDNSKQQNSSEGQTAQQEQQRKELMRKMWRRVSGAGDPLDMVA